MSIRTRRSTVLVAALVALSALVACKKRGRGGSGGPEALPSGPIELRWEQSYKLTVAGSKAEATFFMTHDDDKPPLRLRASFTGFPGGTRVEVGSESGVTSESGYWSALVDVKASLLKLSLDELKAPVDLGLEVVVQPAGGTATKVRLQKQDVKEGLRGAFVRARDGGIDFGPGDTAAAKPRGIAVLGGYSDLDFVGTARTLQEIDLVALAEEVKPPRAGRRCAFEKGEASLELKDAHVTLFERRTGKRLEETTLRASDECPRFAFVKDGKASSTVPASEAVTWARGRLEATSR